MASCGGKGACQPSCTDSYEDGAEYQTQTQTLTLENLSIIDGGGKLCSKCGESEQAYNTMCVSCFRSSLFGKFKLAVTSNAMISPTDKVLIAFSGGPASRVALQFTHEMQYKALKSWDASKSQALPVFGVAVAFIDESMFSHHSPHEVEQAIAEIKSIVADLGHPYKELHIIPIESIYSLERMEGRDRLRELLLTIGDATGREDFLQYLRMYSLQKIALDNKYNKLMLGSCTSGIARHVISSTVKGQGYSLPADLQYVDARWEVPVVLPLRDCPARELSMLCHLDRLKTQQMFDRPSFGINGLVSSFIARLQEENPSRERTIVRTAEKLKPFYFNKFIENGYHDFVPSRLRTKFQNAENGECNPSEQLCSICGSPLCESEMQSMKSSCEKSLTRMKIFVANCCQSCCFQILPKETVSLEHFYSLLPGLVTDKLRFRNNTDRSCLREQIKDCLLSDDDNEGT